MPFIFAYIIKLSVSLGIMYLFYQFVLRRLTFYNWNRAYLLSYSAFSFLIPFINITPALERNTIKENVFIQLVPTFKQAVANNHTSAVEDTISFSWSINDWFLFVILSGISVMGIRLFIQFISFRLMLKEAKLISGDSIKIYQLNKKISPFSFGNSIFINQSMHDQNEIQEIIKHEYVHIKQKHTLDILWAELLCIVNWYNPFAWLIRNAIKQNLEFIADNKVIETGIDKKAYQYLLLKVLGNNYYAITMPFNFSSLKRRIAMMNKLKNTKAHLLKFLFLIPLMTIMLLSFRQQSDISDKVKLYTVAGIMIDNETMQPLADVAVSDSVSGGQAISDKNGYYALKIPIVDKDCLQVGLQYKKAGYLGENAGRMRISNPFNGSNVVVFISISKKIARAGTNSYGGAEIDGKKVEPDYAYVSQKFEEFLYSKKVDSIIAKSSKPVQIIEGIPYACGDGCRAWFDKEEVNNSPECKVWIDGKIMSIDEANARYNRFQFNGAISMSRGTAKEKLNIDCNVLVLFKDKRPTFLDSNADTTKKPITYIKWNDKVAPKMNAQKIAAETDTIYIVADGFSWQNDSLRFNGKVRGTFIKGNDTVKTESTDLYLPAAASTHMRFNHKQYVYGSTYTAQPGEKFKVYSYAAVKSAKDLGVYKNKSTIQIVSDYQ